MNNIGDTEIALSKKKLVLLAFGSAVFIAIGFWLFSYSDRTTRIDAFFLELLGVFSIFFFGIALLYSLRKLFDNSPGLIFNSKGIVDNSSGIAVGFVPWDDITGFSISRVYSQRFLSIQVRDPKKYLNNGNFIKRIFLGANFSRYGSPIHISANAIKTDFDLLVSIFQKYFKNCRST